MHGGRSRFTAVSTGITEFTLVLVCTPHCISTGATVDLLSSQRACTQLDTGKCVSPQELSFRDASKCCKGNMDTIPGTGP